MVRFLYRGMFFLCRAKNVFYVTKLKCLALYASLLLIIEQRFSTNAADSNKNYMLSYKIISETHVK